MLSVEMFVIEAASLSIPIWNILEPVLCVLTIGFNPCNQRRMRILSHLLIVKSGFTDVPEILQKQLAARYFMYKLFWNKFQRVHSLTSIVLLWNAGSVVAEDDDVDDDKDEEGAKEVASTPSLVHFFTHDVHAHIHPSTVERPQ